MPVDEQIRTLIQSYGNAEIGFTEFEKQFMLLYAYEESGCNLFSGLERELLDQLMRIMSRCTEFEEDLKEFPDIYYDTKTFDSEFQKILNELNLVWSK